MFITDQNEREHTQRQSRVTQRQSRVDMTLSPVRKWTEREEPCAPVQRPKCKRKGAGNRNDWIL